jgi:hypothetical protein
MNYISGMAKGAVTTTHAAGTADTTTSNPVNVSGCNAALVHVNISGSGAWTVKLQGAMEANGTYVDLYNGAGSQMTTGSIAADRCQLFLGIPDYLKVVATEDSGTATVEIKIQPMVV